MNIQLEVFTGFDAGLAALLERLWNAASSPELAWAPRLVQHNLQARPSVLQALCLASAAGQALGFVYVTSFNDGRGQNRDAASVLTPDKNYYIDALAVLPEARRQGAGSRLLQWAETWCAGQGCARLRLGGGPYPFFPGLPVELDSQAFFLQRGYAARPQNERVWDVACRLPEYAARPRPSNSLLDVHPLQEDEAPALQAFLECAFPGRWPFEFQEHLRAGGRPGDYLGLWQAGRLLGFCRITLEDSLLPVQRFYPGRLPPPWGQLGPIGIDPALHAQGYGSLLLDAALRHLRRQGVDGCIIDWTHLLSFYQKFGFQPYREYLMLLKELA